MDLKYLYLPKKFWKYHDRCMFLISHIEEYIIKDEFKNLRIASIPLDKGNVPQEDEHFLDFLLRTGKKEEHDDIM